MATITSTPSPRISAAVLRASWRHWSRLSTPRAGPAWLQLVWTALFSAALALGFTLLAFATTMHTMAQWGSWRLWRGTYCNNLVVTLVIGYVTRALFALAWRALGRPRIVAMAGWRRSAFFIGMSLLGVVIGWPIGGALLNGDPRVLLNLTAPDILSMIVMTVVVCGLLSTWFALRNRHLMAEMRANDAQLRLLQGQMEPHFLFNTLANVISLIDADAPGAKRMLEDLTEYLRASLGSLRRIDSTLASELELATCYLKLMRTRMGERLRFDVDVPPELHGVALPPLLLQPLVENAVKHGLEPQVAGGAVCVRGRAVRIDGLAAIELCIEDDGIGLAAAAARGRRPAARTPDGNGIALANLRERLQALFGSAATLTLADAGAAGGTRACLVLPLRHGAAPVPGAPQTMPVNLPSTP